MSRETVFENQFFELVRYTGKLIDTQHSSTTHVSGGGGEFVSINSHVNEKNTFFLIDEQGTERSFTIHNWDFAMRSGHEIEVYGLFNKKTNFGEYVMLKNQNLNEYSIHDNGIKAVIKKKFKSLMILAFVLMIGGVPMILPLFLLLLVSILPFIKPIIDSIKGVVIMPVYIIAFLAIYPVYKWICHKHFSQVKNSLLAESKK